jgi:hypothetical protein
VRRPREGCVRCVRVEEARKPRGIGGERQARGRRVQNAKTSSRIAPDKPDLRVVGPFCQLSQARLPSAKIAKSEEAAPTRNRNGLENKSGRLTTVLALCVRGYDDNYNVANGGTDQSTDGETIVVSAFARNNFAVAISSRCGESDRGHVSAR